MKITRRLKITVTQRRVLRPAVQGFCPVCACEVEMLSVSQAAAVLETDLAGFNRLLAAGRLHAILLTVSGGIRVCQDSLTVRAKASGQ